MVLITEDVPRGVPMRNPLMPRWMCEVGLAIEITASVRKLQDLATQLRALVSASP